MKKEIIRIPPHWFGFIGSLFCGILAGILALIKVDPAYPKISDSLLLILCGCSLVCSCIYSVFYENCLVICLLGIPLRKVPYTKISSVVWITKSNAQNGSRFHHKLVFTILPYQLTDKVMAGLKKRRRNPFHTIAIYLPYRKDAAYFQKLRNCLDNIPVVDLEWTT